MFGRASWRVFSRRFAASAVRTRVQRVQRTFHSHTHTHTQAFRLTGGTLFIATGVGIAGWAHSAHNWSEQQYESHDDKQESWWSSFASFLLPSPAVAEEANQQQSSSQSQSQALSQNNVKYIIDASKFEDFALFSGTANLPLAEEIAQYLNVPLGSISIKGFADGEIGIQVNENVRGKDVYLIQPTCPPGVNDHLVELLLMISTMRRASARKITAIMPYYGYSRQDRKMASRVPISAADVARLLQAMGVDRVVAVDLHCGQIQGFFGPRTPCDNLEGHVVALPYFQSLGLNGDTTKVVSPDAGGVYRAKRFRDGLKNIGVDAGLAMIVKQRAKANSIERMDLVGSVDGCDVVIVDDMIDTAGTLTKAAGELRQMGAKRIYAFATHGLFSDPAYERINNSILDRVVVCNTVPLNASRDSSKIVQVSVAKMLSEAIARIHLKKSVSALFEKN